MSTIQKIVAFIITIGLILIGVFTFGLYPKAVSAPIQSSQSAQLDNSSVKAVSTNLTLDGSEAVISPTQTLTVTFNQPMVQDATRIIVDPKVGYRTQNSNDHKTIEVIPDSSFGLGIDYTLTIKSGYDTDNGKKLDSDQVFHFKTISYNGV